MASPAPLRLHERELLVESGQTWSGLWSLPEHHDQEVWECLCHILTVPTGPESVARASHDSPTGHGRIGFEEC